MSLLVTGGAGFIGSNFIRRVAPKSSEPVVVLDALTYAGNLSSLDGVDGFTFVKGDICDRDLLGRVLAEHAIDRIVHFAAESHVDRSIHGPAQFIQTNVVGTATLLEAARAHGVLKFVHVSTDEVYGDLGPDEPAFTEETPIRPRSPYSASKAGSDHLVRAYFETYGFPMVITRCSNNYGPFQFPEKLIPLMILNALDGQRLPVYGDGLNVRDWIHVKDHCAAVERVLQEGRSGEVYNIGGRAERTNISIVKEILRLLQKPESLIQFVQDRLGHDRRYAIDCTKIERELGFVPQHRFENGLAETIEWFRQNDVWCKRARSGEYRDWYERNYRGRKDAPK